MSAKARSPVVSRWLLLLTVAALAPPATARPADGAVVGWIEDATGAPIAGALVSLFGKGLTGGGLVTLSDSAGRFALPSLPPGSYTLRALGSGRAMTQRITVLPNQDSIFTLSFAAGARSLDVETAIENASQNEREWKWLLRHKRRSVLEARDAHEGARVAESIQATRNLLETLVPWIPELGGAVELMTAPAAFGPSADARGELASPSLGALKLNGRLSDSARWSLGGLLADTETTSWRMAAEFVLEPGDAHRLQAGAGYGTRMLQPGFAGTGSGGLDNRSVGAVFVQDSWQAAERLTVSGGARYSYIGFAADKSAFSPTVGVEYRTGANTVLAAQSSARTLTPGGDLLTLSTLRAAPAMTVAVMSPDVRPERLLRHELSARHAAGAASFGAFVFRESARDRLLNELRRPGDSRTLRIVNGNGLVVHGGGVHLARNLGTSVRTSLTYTYGRSYPGDASAPTGLSLRHADAALASSDASFHDVVARVEALVDRSGTRVVAYYRLNACHSRAEPVGTAFPALNQRFDVQLSQDLPFLRSVTRTDWEVLLAFRNLFYEVSDAGVLDEIAVVNPPKRVLGGISVRF